MTPSGWLRIGDVALELDVPAYVLRYWQEEFGLGRSVKRALHSQQRCYPPETVATFREIKRLLKVELYTIAGAKRQLRLKAEREREAG